MQDNNAMHAKPDLRAEFEPDDHFFRLGDLGRYPPQKSQKIDKIALVGTNAI